MSFTISRIVRGISNNFNIPPIYSQSVYNIQEAYQEITPDIYVQYSSKLKQVKQIEEVVILGEVDVNLSKSSHVEIDNSSLNK